MMTELDSRKSLEDCRRPELASVTYDLELGALDPVEETEAYSGVGVPLFERPGSSDDPTLVINDRVTLVGERTGGGGHFGDDITVSPDLRLFMPRGRTYDPETGQGWEAEGIEPDIKALYLEARDRAIQAIQESK